MFHQTCAIHDLFVVLVLVLLEGVLSIDNALVLGLLARRLPEQQRGKALSYGLVGAMVFRIAAIFLANLLVHSKWLQIIGGLYLLYLPIKHFISPHKNEEEITTVPTEPAQNHAAAGVDAPISGPSAPAPIQNVEIHYAAPAKASSGFWWTVLVIELTDVAFAVDSILAAVAMVVTDHPPTDGRIHPKMWVIITGGLIGVMLVRFAAKLFIGLLDKFPRFEMSAYLLVLVIGAKLLLDAIYNAPGQPHRFDFSSRHSISFWVLWIVMAICFCVGFIPSKSKMQAENFVD